MGRRRLGTFVGVGAVGRGVLSVLRMNSAEGKSLQSERPWPPSSPSGNADPRERCPYSTLHSDTVAACLSGRPASWESPSFTL